MVARVIAAASARVKPTWSWSAELCLERVDHGRGQRLALLPNVDKLLNLLLQVNGHVSVYPFSAIRVGACVGDQQQRARVRVHQQLSGERAAAASNSSLAAATAALALSSQAPGI